MKMKTIDFGRDQALCVPGGDFRSGLVRWELLLAEEEGRGASKRERLAKLAQGADEETLLDLYEQALKIPDDPKLDRAEPYDLESIRKLRPKAKQRRFATPRRDDAWLYDRLYGAWLGRCAGCTLGGPGETFRPHTRERLIKYLTAVSPDEWPINDYMPAHSPSSGLKFSWKMDATRENLRYAPADDDLTHTMMVQIALSELKRPDHFQARDLASAWFRFMPYSLMEGGTGMMAFRNLVLRYPMSAIRCKMIPDADIDWYWVATHSNPYRFDIDGGLRADSHGYAVLGLPELAAEMAWRDARMSNTRTGLYCSMFYAAMIAAAFAHSDPVAVVEAGLAEIPATSRLAAEIRKMIAICRKHGFDPKRILDVQEENIRVFSGDDCSTVANVAAIVSSLLMGGNDFGNVIRFTVMAGLDCDSTAATSGSIAGAMLGAKRLPTKWIKPLNDTVYGNIVGYHPIAISECARRSLEICKRVPDFFAIAAIQARKDAGKLPRECVVFGPVDRDAPPLKAAKLAKLPKTLSCGGKTLQPCKMKRDADGRLDLAAVIGATGAAADGVGAYIFIPFTLPREQTMLFGFGADWWFTAYMDGREIATNEPDGNLAAPPYHDQFLSPVLSLAKGAHVLAIRFRSGSFSSVLVVAEAKEMKRGNRVS
jgi:hypothetical protein